MFFNSVIELLFGLISISFLSEERLTTLWKQCFSQKPSILHYISASLALGGWPNMYLT